MRVGVVILAAGESSRLGRPKQLLKENGEALLTNLISIIKSLKLPVITVLGAYYDQILEELPKSDVLFNPEWKKGMGNTLKYGLKHLIHQNPDLNGVIFLVSDQPLLTKEVLIEVLNEFKHKGQIISCKYNNQDGVPVLFEREYFDELLQIPNQSGAKGLLRKYKDKVNSINFPGGQYDIDTEEDWQRFINQS